MLACVRVRLANVVALASHFKVPNACAAATQPALCRSARSSRLPNPPSLPSSVSPSPSLSPPVSLPELYTACLLYLDTQLSADARRASSYEQ